MPALEAKTTTKTVLDAQFADAERVVNGVRIAVIGALGIAAALYAPFLTRALTLANILVIAPVLLWAIGQHFAVHARPSARPWRLLSPANAVVDTTAVTALLVAYGLLGSADLALKSPVWVTYFVILAARPFCGSARLAAVTALTALVQYAAMTTYFVYGSHLPTLADPMAPLSQSGTSILLEVAKLMLLAIAGGIATYATAWNERTLLRTVESMRASEARFRAVFERSAVGIALLDGGSRIVETNDAFARFVGYDASELAGREPYELSPAEDAGLARDLMHQVSEHNESSAAAELRYVRRDGKIAWGSLTLSRAEGAADLRVIAMVQDVSRRKALEAELVHQAFHDPLTGLANRVLFKDRVDHALSRTAREEGEVAVLFLDLDNFKQVNDTLGHAAGDALLNAVAKRLLNATRGCDTVARLGGDEFAVLLENVRCEADTEIVADRIKASLQQPVETGNGRTAHATVSIGIARTRMGEGSEELLRNADVAMYAAKSNARGDYVKFDPSMHAALVDKVSLEADLKAALENEELYVAYQPIVDLDTSQVTGVEALARWNHQTRGMVPPSVFIPLAEENGLIVQLGRWVLREACRQGAVWNSSRPHRPLTMTVNVSGRQLSDPGLVGEVQEVLRETGLPATQLVLEITESVIMRDTELTMRRLRELKSLGVRLAVDDFGTGYSSLSHLQQFPVDVLKIDRSFTTGIPHDSNSAALARTIIALGNMLTMRTVAEGVETEQQHHRLKELGCSLGQGYLFSRPVAPSVVTSMLTGPLTPRSLASMVGVSGD